MGPEIYSDSAEIANIDPGILGIAFAISIIFYVLNSYFLGKVFNKAGVESWKAWVPFYSSFILLELGEYSGWWVLVAFVPFVGGVIFTVVLLLAIHNVNGGFGAGIGMTVLYFFIPVVWAGVLGLGENRWNKRRPLRR